MRVTDTPIKSENAAIFGSGPAGLMAASVLSNAGVAVSLFERRPSYGRKLLIAGSSGLNVSHQTSLEDFISHYEGFSPEVWGRFFKVLSPEAWIQFIESLGLETFVGTSSRYFVKEMKATGLLRAWRAKLEQAGVRFIANHEWQGLQDFSGFQVSGLFLGGGSWEDVPPLWPERMRALEVQVQGFAPANVGYEVAWSDAFLKEAEGKPFKNILLKNKKGQKAGELVVTRYGIEGTPIYFLGESGPAFLDLKPAMSEGEILERLKAVRENLSPIRRVKKLMALPEASLALLFHETEERVRSDLGLLVKHMKSFPLELRGPRPLLEAISSTGGVDLNEVHLELGRELELKKIPGVFVGGEMLNWTAPTGGFLIQGAVTQGAVAGQNMLRYLERMK